MFTLMYRQSVRLWITKKEQRTCTVESYKTRVGVAPSDLILALPDHIGPLLNLARDKYYPTSTLTHHARLSQRHWLSGPFGKHLELFSEGLGHFQNTLMSVWTLSRRRVRSGDVGVTPRARPK